MAKGIDSIEGNLISLLEKVRKDWKIAAWADMWKYSLLHSCVDLRRLHRES